MPAPYTYAGTELDVFAHASNWKRYWSSRVAPFLRGRVLEVGAGIGANTRVLFRPGIHDWHCLEPDATLADRLRASLSGDPGLRQCQVIQGTIAEISPAPAFDSILYADVLEHIEDDSAELERAALRLTPGGMVIVLSPAGQWLYTAFDRAIGHFRRYSKASLTRLSPAGTTLRVSEYLDSAGWFLSAMNRLVLRSASPSLNQIRVWDKLVVPCSRLMDPALGRTLGKSVLCVWERIAP